MAGGGAILALSSSLLLLSSSSCLLFRSFNSNWTKLKLILCTCTSCIWIQTLYCDCILGQ
jgi:hypothetical protein